MSTVEVRPFQQSIELEQAVSASNVARVHGRGDAVVHALRGVSVEIAPGELAAVVGSTGSGKSTLLHVLAGLDRPTTGDVRIAGVGIRDLKQAQLRRLRRRHVGFVYQFFNLLPSMTAEENILEPLVASGTEPDPGWIAELLALIDLRGDRSTPASRLSRGQQQKVAIARALVSRPTVLFADEPTGAVVAGARDEIVELLRHAASSYAQTIVLTTDDPQVAAIAARCLTLDAGLIVADA